MMEPQKVPIAVIFDSKILLPGYRMSIQVARHNLQGNSRRPVFMVYT